MDDKQPQVIGSCPHCGVPVFSFDCDYRRLPIPEYICTCRWRGLEHASAPFFYSDLKKSGTGEFTRKYETITSVDDTSEFLKKYDLSSTDE